MTTCWHQFYASWHCLQLHKRCYGSVILTMVCVKNNHFKMAKRDHFSRPKIQKFLCVATMVIYIFKDFYVFFQKYPYYAHVFRNLLRLVSWKDPLIKYQQS